MKKNNILFFLIFLLTISIIFLAYFILNESILFSPKDQDYDCKILEKNSEKGINFVFFSNKEIAEEYKNELFKVEPFSSNKDKFNFYYINNYFPKCDLYKGIALDCYNKELIRVSSSCPNDIIVVIKEGSPEIRSSAYMNVISLNSNSNKKVFTHEVGHVLGNLADEYVPANFFDSARNCMKKCEDFSISEGCFQGCSLEDRYRSIEDGIMRNLYSDRFGVFNEKVLEEKINKISSKKRSSLVGFAIKEKESCSEEESLLLTGRIKNSSIFILGVEKLRGCVGSNGFGEEASYSLILEEGFKTEEIFFSPNILFLDLEKNLNLSGGIQNYEGLFYLKAPYLTNLENIEINFKNETFSFNLNLENNRPCRIK